MFFTEIASQDYPLVEEAIMEENIQIIKVEKYEQGTELDGVRHCQGLPVTHEGTLHTLIAGVKAEYGDYIVYCKLDGLDYVYRTTEELKKEIPSPKVISIPTPIPVAPPKLKPTVKKTVKKKATRKKKEK